LALSLAFPFSFCLIPLPFPFSLEWALNSHLHFVLIRIALEFIAVQLSFALPTARANPEQ
jgi:hypothetical protein